VLCASLWDPVLSEYQFCYILVWALLVFVGRSQQRFAAVDNGSNT